MKALSDTSLPALAAAVRREHDAARTAVGVAVAHGMAAGEALIAAKAALPHGAWAAWLKANVPDLGVRSVQLYMRLARNRHQIEAQRVADLPLREAVKLLSRPILPTAREMGDAAMEELGAMEARYERGDWAALVAGAWRVIALVQAMQRRSDEVMLSLGFDAATLAEIRERAISRRSGCGDLTEGRDDG